MTTDSSVVDSPAPKMSTHSALFEHLRSSEQRERRSRQVRRIAVWGSRIAILLLALLSWQWASDSGLVNQLFFSRPTDIWDSLTAMTTTSEFWQDTWFTVWETMVSFALGSVLGVAAGLLLAQFTFANDVLSPFLTFLNAIPRVALAPIFIIWFGIGSMSKIVLAISLIFFIMLVNTDAGVKSIDDEYLRTVKAMGATPFQRFRMVVLPGITPTVLGGLRLSVVYAFLGVIFGEMLGAEHGLGKQIQLKASTFDTPGAFAVLLVLSCLAIVLTGLVGAGERHLLKWRRA